MAGELGGVARTSPRGPSPRKPVIFLSVGEPSGDMHGAALARAIRQRIPDARLIGLGGRRMAAAGVEILVDVEELAVMGFVEVLARLPFFLRLRREVFQTLGLEQVDLVIPIDYPGFNLRLAGHARARGIPVLYYIAPQVWAWHRSRVKALARDASRVAVVLPFEEEFFRAAGADVEFVGHPLLDTLPSARERSAWFSEQHLDPARPLLALFPGSRLQEVRRHLRLFCETARRVVERRPEVQVLIGAPVEIGDGAYREAAFGVTRDSAELLRQASAALAKSGTTTLEAALAGVPFVVVYCMNPLTFQLAKRLVDVPHIALANLVAGERIAPEFIQGEAQPDTLASALLPLLDEFSPERVEMRGKLSEVRVRLRKGGAADRVAEIAEELLGHRE